MGEQETMTGIPGMPEALREQLHQAGEICEKLEKLNAAGNDNFDAELGELTAAYAALPPLPPEYAEIMVKKFDAAVAAAKSTLAAAEEFQKKRENAAADIGKFRKSIEKFAKIEILFPKLNDIRELERKYNEAAALVKPEQAFAEEFKPAFAIFYERISAEEKANAEKTAAVTKFVEELKTLTGGEDMKLLQERKNAIEKEYAALSAVPPEAAALFKEAQKSAGAKLSRHYETLDLARWESYTLKTKLCDELAAMQQSEDKELGNTAKKLNELRVKWKTLGAVPKAKFEEINQRYLELTRALQHRIDEHFAKLHKEHKAAAAAKKELCEQAAKLAGLTSWNETAAAFKELQAKWKTIPSAGQEEHELFTNFRASADQFFNARSSYFDERNKRFDAAAAVKQSLIAEAETLGNGEITPDVIRKAKDLRTRYQEAERCGKHEQELGKTFNAALDKVFNARRAAFAEKETKSRALLTEAETLAGSLTPENFAASDSRFRAICEEWKELACRNTFNAEEAAKKRFDDAAGSIRKQLRDSQFERYRQFAPVLAARYAKFRAGTPETEEFSAGLPLPGKLHSAAELLAAAEKGDAKAAERLEKLSRQAVAEQTRICEEIEALAGDSKPAAPRSLAEELEAAIAGNFGAGSIRPEKKKDCSQLLNEFLSVVPLEEEFLRNALERFSGALAKCREQNR